MGKIYFLFFGSLKFRIFGFLGEMWFKFKELKYEREIEIEVKREEK